MKRSTSGTTHYLSDPDRIARSMPAFLRRELDTAAIAAVVHPTLHRSYRA